MKKEPGYRRTQKDAWKTFFCDQELAEARRAFRFGNQTFAEVEQVLRKSRPAEGARILDLGCGIGRHSIELAKRGFAVTGFDYCNAYLAEARKAKRNAKIGPRLRFVQGDMRTLEQHFPPENFSLVILLFNSFGYFDNHREHCRVLCQIASILKPNGALVMDMMDLAGLERHWRKVRKNGDILGPYRQEYKLGSFLSHSYQYDPSSRKLLLECWLPAKNAKLLKRFAVKQRIYSVKEFAEMLKPAALKIEQTWGSLIDDQVAGELERSFLIRKI